MTEDRIGVNDYKDALMSQSAVNVSGLTNSLATIMSKLWNTARDLGKGTAWVNQHPIVNMFAYQIANLSHKREPMEWEGYHKAYMICIEVEKGNLSPNIDYANYSL